MSKYRRLTKGLNNVGTLIPADADPYKFVTDTKKDWYLSIYEYNEEQKKLAEEEIHKNGNKRIRGVGDIKDVTTNVLAFDVDSKDLNEAKKDAIAICERLDSMGVKFADQNISFSGGKGFSVVVYHDKQLNPKEHKSIAKEIAGNLGTFDTTIYNASRIFRLDHTKHQGSGLFKTPLTFDELNSMDIKDIKQLAKEEYDVVVPKKTTLPAKVYNLKKVEPPKPEKKATTIVNNLNFSKKPPGFTDVKYALHQGYIPEGKGNEGMMILCSLYRNLNFDISDAYRMLKSVNEKRSEIYGIEKRDNNDIWNQVVTTIYSPTWKGGMYSPQENELLVETATEFGITDKSNIVEIGQVRKRFLDFAENINKNVIRTGIKSLDKEILITTGMPFGVLAAPSAGKTSLATQIVESLSLQDQHVLFLSLDMHDNLLYQRLLQRVSGIDVAKKLRSKIETDESYDPEYTFAGDEDLAEAFDDVDDVYKNVNFDFTRGCTIESIEENIKINKTKLGDNLKMVVVDYLEKVRGPYSDATANSGYVASRLSDLASTYDIAIMVLLQPQKSAGDPSEELLSMRKVKGASVIEQDLRLIMTLWRPGFSPKNSGDDRYASIAIVKNNMGPVTQIDFGWNGLKGKFSELTGAERSHLSGLRETLAEEKEDKKKKEWDI